LTKASKSRIHLALHYKNLDTSQQKNIWRNLLTRIKDLYENDIDELIKKDLNRRQTRNGNTTARPLARYQKKEFCYEHLKYNIEVSGEFENYLNGLRAELSCLTIRSSGRMLLDGPEFMMNNGLPSQDQV